MVAALQNAASIVTFAPAKLNLFLELHARRPDGFHDLETVMLPVDCVDRLRLIRRDDDQIVLRCRWSPSAAVWRKRLGSSERDETAEGGTLLTIPGGPENLVYKALAGFRDVFAGDSQATSMPPGFEVELEKRIPAGAGMGGASSNAAAAIRGAAALTSIPLTDPRLWKLAAELGSDVPFFLGVRSDTHGEGAGRAFDGRCRAVIATGRGEELASTEMHGDLRFVICYPPQALSTAKVYRDCTVPEQPASVEPLLDALSHATSDSVGDGLFNRLSEPSQALSPHVERILQEMSKVGLKHRQMTGSGSACFAIASTQRRARRASQLLSSRGLGVTMVARSIAVPMPIIWQAA